MFDKKKFYALEGDLAHNNPGNYLQSVLLKLNVPFVHQYVALLTCIDSWPIWHSDGICVLDYRHFSYQDFIFRDYIKSLVDSGVKILKVSDMPFLYECNTNSLQQQLDRLSNRTSILYDLVCSKGVVIKLLSPSIGAFSEEVAKYYKLYFSEFHDIFDVYSVACDIEGTDRSLARLVGLLNELLDLTKQVKQVWVTKWCIPAYDKDVVSSKIGNSNIRIQRLKVAAARMKYVFQTMNMIIPYALWFIAGVGRDYYSPSKQPKDFFFDWPYTKDDWTNENFMGLLDYSGVPKFHLVQALSEIVTTVAVNNFS